VLKSAKGLRFYADNGAAFMADEPIDARLVGAGAAYTRWEPIGPVLAVMPWNYPLWQVFRFAAPALMAGNTCVLKHASNVPRSAVLIEETFRDAGFPAGAFQTLLVGSGAVAALIADHRIAAVTITGSEAAGRSVASAAGAALKKSVLELGGSDAFVVMPSADLAAAAQAGAQSRLQNAGQSCICAKRFVVHQAVYDEFLSLLVKEMAAYEPGDPFEAATNLGPLATRSGLADVAGLVDDAIALGAVAVIGGRSIEGAGWFYPPTVLKGITAQMRVAREEVFGPVALVYSASDLDDAIRIANSTNLGLSSNAWTGDTTEAAELVWRLDAGGVFINGATASFPELPFGGIKASGYGRELAALGMREFCNAKTVWIAASK